jgi:hypothetical protein
MFGNITNALRQIKSDVASVLEASVIRRLCVQLDHRWRDRQLDPVTTVHGFLLQVLHGNTACSHVPRLLGKSFSGEAYCQARARLPLELLERLLGEVCSRLQTCLEDSSRWLGHRIWLVDGSSCSMPDTPALQAAFGQPGQQAAGCGFPVAHLLTLFHAGTGLLLRTIVGPLRTHDMAQAAQLHGELATGDVLVADRGFCSYAHLALLASAGLQAVFRLHQKQLVDFRIGRMHSPPKGRYKNIKGLPRTRWIKWLGACDQLVEYPKPKEVPDWLEAAAYDTLPATMTLRELRYRIEQPGCRTREVILVTTLLDPKLYPATELAGLYGQRWQVETNLRHLKQTLHMDVLRTKTVAGIHKELAMFALVYNLVRLVMIEAAAKRKLPIERISFIGALRWLCHARCGATLDDLELVPRRPGRHEPRVRKRRPKQYDLMNQPRQQLREALNHKELTH